MKLTPTILATAILLLAGNAFAARTGGFATADGGDLPGARYFTAANYQEINNIITSASTVPGGAYPLVITYTGNEDAAIATIVMDHNPDAAGNCPNPHWNDAYRQVAVTGYTAGLTILGADGSSGNFGITLTNSSNVVIRNMKLGALGGAAKDADLLRVDSSSNVWIDHNELLSNSHECNGSPEGDLTFEGAIDIKKNSHNVTVSYNYIHDHKKVGLDGSSGTDIAGGREITFHHNLYSNVSQRLPLQRGGWTHMYNNLYSGITDSGINVRREGYALIEQNWFENSVNPVVCRYDATLCGWWDLRNNNVKSPADFNRYGIAWTPDDGINTVTAIEWKTTAVFPKTLPYVYESVSPQCVKNKLRKYAGVGKKLKQLTPVACLGRDDDEHDMHDRHAPAGDYMENYTKCADAGEICKVKTGAGWVAFGRKGNWVTKYIGTGHAVSCTVASFGSDPGGRPNKCSYRVY
ncbi:right-handed parallel beta-helix repeat-containing protein [Uliginosibacterium sp. 31-12]|uniref:pectate lyase family protein n=1 Tax=Uliginosibacterium sp. 31-12 TaxID=3062781 RepID=UPI0026E43E0F|nr:right-handed parallel beta-helix repeat-containing protein [Uliginosibacterium sp. 31-12]MDO6386737.1 right-handed parallel beta-helix repeat-containing protein [Uliginosibacterium sp. 31-12]